MKWSKSSKGPPRWLRGLEQAVFEGNVKKLDLFILEKAGRRRVDSVISSFSI